MKKEFLVSLAPTDDLAQWVAQWKIQSTMPDIASKTSGPTIRSFDKKVDAVRWFSSEAVAFDFDVLVPEDFETRIFISVAVIHDR